jgi:hypothetical protein
MHQHFAKLVHNNHIVAKITRHEKDIAWSRSIAKLTRHEPRILSEKNHEIIFSLYYYEIFIR